MHMRSLFYFLVVMALISCSKDVPEPSPTPEGEVQGDDRFEQMVLIEPTVSVGCGACPLAHHEVEKLEDSLDYITHISHYLYGPLFHPYSKYLLDKINKTVYTPLGHVDRMHEDGSVVYYPVDMFEPLAKDAFAASTDVSLKVTAALTSDQLQLSLEVESDEVAQHTSLRVTVLLVEREVVGEGTGYDQRNYGHDDPDHPYYQQGEYIQGFVHTNVIRHVLTSFEGDVIDITSGKTSWSGTIDLVDLEGNTAAYNAVAFVSKDGEEVMPIINTSVLQLSSL